MVPVIIGVQYYPQAYFTVNAYEITELATAGVNVDVTLIFIIAEN